MKNVTVVKPIVHFSKFSRFMHYNYGSIAVLLGVKNHPNLGDQPVVYTSLILDMDNEEAPTLIQTLNTIYKLEP